MARTPTAAAHELNDLITAQNDDFDCTCGSVARRQHAHATMPLQCDLVRHASCEVSERSKIEMNPINGTEDHPVLLVHSFSGPGANFRIERTLAVVQHLLQRVRKA